MCIISNLSSCSVVDVAQISQGLFALLSFSATTAIGFVVYFYTKRRDRLQFHHETWSLRQQINMMTISNPEVMNEFEEIVNGKTIDKKTSMKMLLIFMNINNIQNYYFAYMNKIITKKEYENYAIDVLDLLCRQGDLLNYCIDNRGYDDDFANDIKRLMSLAKVRVPPEIS